MQDKPTLEEIEKETSGEESKAQAEKAKSEQANTAVKEGKSEVEEEGEKEKEQVTPPAELKKPPTYIDVEMLNNNLNKEGREAAGFIIKNPATIALIEKAWQEGTPHKLTWKELKDTIGVDNTGEDLEKKGTERRGGEFYSVLFIENQEGVVQPYLIAKEIKKGGKAVLKNAYNLATGEHVALKIIRNVTTELSKEEIEREAKGLGFFKRLVGQQQRPEKSKHYLAQDLIQGVDIDGYLMDVQKRLHEDRKNANVSVVQTIFHTVALVLNELNKLHADHFVHRDLKPGNIMVRMQKEQKTPGSEVKDALLIDFGSMDKNSGQAVDLSVGTTAYLAPELQEAEDVGNFTQATDVYAVGKIVEKLLKVLEEGSMQSVFARDLRKERSALGEFRNGLNKIMSGMLMQNPNERLTASEALDMLRTEINKVSGASFLDQETVNLLAAQPEVETTLGT